jgi:hypothetical protein
MNPLINVIIQDVECKDESSTHQVQGLHKFEKITLMSSIFYEFHWNCGLA